MTLHEALLTNPNFEFRGNLFYQKGLPTNQDFENAYLKIREKEGRLYSDDQIKILPHYKGNPELESEWKIRKQSAERLIQYLKSQGSSKLILELGCGNGWLSNLISIRSQSEVVAMDLNEVELKQARQIFINNSYLNFVYGNIFSAEFTSLKFDSIILAASVQYFPDLKALLTRLFSLLKNSGEIHIVDSAFYTPQDLDQARLRSKSYYENHGMIAMGQYYFHHRVDELKSYRPFYLINQNAGRLTMVKDFLGINSSGFYSAGIRKSDQDIKD